MSRPPVLDVRQRHSLPKKGGRDMSGSPPCRFGRRRSTVRRQQAEGRQEETQGWQRFRFGHVGRQERKAVCELKDSMTLEISLQRLTCKFISMLTSYFVVVADINQCYNSYIPEVSGVPHLLPHHLYASLLPIPRARYAMPRTRVHLQIAPLGRRILVSSGSGGGRGEED